MNGQRKALVLVTTSFPIRGDGSEAAGGFVADLAEALSAHVPVRVVAPGERNVRETWREGVEVFRFAAPDRPLSTLKPWRLSDLSTIRRVLAAGQAATRDAVQAGPSAHVLALWALPSGHWARQVWRETGVPYSVWTLGSDIWSLGRIPVVRSFLVKVLRDARNCYSDGLALAGETQRIGRRNVDFLPSTRSISRRRSQPLKTEPPYRLLFLGRWHLNKGVDLLLDALAMLDDGDWKRIEVVEISGGGPLEPLVRDRVNALYASGRSVEMNGFLDKQAAEESLVKADYVVIPSRIESIPVIFSDAMKVSCPVLATSVGDLKGLVSRQPACGLLAPTAQVGDIATVIRAGLRSAPADFAEATRREAARFDLKRIASLIIESTGTAA